MPIGKLKRGALLAIAFASVGCEQSFEEFDCADIEDDELIAFVTAPYEYPPWDWQGFSGRTFSESCISSTEELWQRIEEERPWGDHREREFAALAPRYYEAYDYGHSEYRAFRCDCFDGTTLAGAPFHDTDALIEPMRMEMYFRLTSWSPRNTRYLSAS